MHTSFRSVLVGSGLALSLVASSSVLFAGDADQQPGVQTSKLEAEHYAVEVKTEPFYKVNETGRYEIKIAAKNGFHLNEKYPIKFVVKEPLPEGIKVEKPKLLREDGTFGKNDGTFKVQFIPSKAGTTRLAGTLSVSFCTEERCLTEKLDLDANLQAK